MKKELVELLQLAIHDLRFSIHRAFKIIGPFFYNTLPFVIYEGTPICPGESRKVYCWIHWPVYRLSMYHVEAYFRLSYGDTCGYADTISFDDAPEWISYRLSYCPSEVLKTYKNMKELARTLDEQSAQIENMKIRKELEQERAMKDIRLILENAKTEGDESC